MSRHSALCEWAAVVSTHLPHLTKPQARVLALWSYGMVLTRSCGITTVAVFVSGLLNRKEDAVRQQLREWCYDAADKKGREGKGHNRECLDVTTCFVPLLRWIVERWSSEEKRIALALDATLLGERLAVLAISVVYRGCAIPVAWRVVRANTKGAWRPHLTELVILLSGAVPGEWTVIVCADRGLYAKWLYRQIVKIGWHPYLRINRGAKYRLLHGSVWHYIDTLVPHIGTKWSGQVACFSARDNTLKCTLLAVWDEGHEEAWFVLTDLAPDVADVAWYGMRSWIECGFKDLKGGGWGWHQTKMTDPARAERLWLAMSVATLWAVSVGGEAEANLPASSLLQLPITHIARTRTRTRRHVRTNHATTASIFSLKPRHLSCFARGLTTILLALLNGEPLPLGPFLPLPWPSSVPASQLLPSAA
jgi:hypothetical protein